MFRKYKSFFPEFFNQHPEGVAEKFCEQFFLTGFDESIMSYFAKISLKDNSERNITLSIRIPAHPVFNEKLPDTVAVSVIVFCPTDKNNPIFIPQRVSLTYGALKATGYEQEVDITFRQLGEREFPHDSLPNILSARFVKSLPKFAIKTKDRLEAWEDFLTFKENLIKHKIQGVRYLHWKFIEEAGQLQFFVIAENEKDLKCVRQVFKRQNLHAFDLKVSNDPYLFILAQNNKDKLGSGFGNFGQLANNGLQIIQKNCSDRELLAVCNDYRKTLQKK